MEEFKNRLLKYIESHLCISIRAFEEMCGLTNGTIGSIGGKGPGAAVLMKIAHNCPELDMNWLLRGSGDMVLSKKTDTESHSTNNIHDNDQVNINYFASLKEVIKQAIKEVKEES